MSDDEDEDGIGGLERLRHYDVLQHSGLVMNTLHALDGQKLRASRALLDTDGKIDIPGSRDHTLVFNLGGSLNVRRFYDGKLSGVVNRLRTTTIVPAFRSSEWDIGGESDVLHIYIDDSTLRSIAEEGFGTGMKDVEILDTMSADDEVISALAPLIMQEMTSGGPASSLMLDSFDQVIATHLLLRYSSRGEQAKAVISKPSPAQDRDLVARITTYLIDRLDENVSLQDVADHVGLSKFYVQRRFRSELGLSPHEFVLQARLKKARDLLRGDTSLADIAYDCGFSSQQHMTNAFTRHMGLSPGRYRKHIRA